MTRGLALLAATALVLPLAACGEDDDPPRATTGATETAANGCERVSRPRPRPDGELRRPAAAPAASLPTRAHIETNCGTITVALERRAQPRTVGSFAALARRGFFDGLTFHRIARGPDGGDFVVQGGDPLGTGLGGAGYTVTERPPRGARYVRGTVAMAKTEVEPPGTSGSQFFVVTAEDAGLPPDYAVLGRVTGDDAALRRLASTPADPASQRPETPLVIERVTVSR